MAASQPNIPAMRQEAGVRFRAGHYQEALSLYKQVVDLQPTDLTAKHDLMWAQWNSGHYGDAAQTAKEILQYAPDNPEAKMIITREPLTANRGRAKALRQQAVERYQAGDYAKASALYKQLVDLNPQDPSVLRDWMWAQWGQENYAEAGALADKVLALRPGDPDASDVLHRLPQALKEQKMATKRAQIVALENVVNSAEADKGYAQAIPLLSDIVAMDPSSTNFNHLLSTLRKAGRLDDGLLVAQQMTAVYKDNPESWNWLATFQLDLGMVDDAMASDQHALSLKPDQPRTQLSMGKMYVTMREFDRAITYLYPASLAKPPLAESYPLLGKAYYWSAQYDKAVPMFRKAAEVFPQIQEYRYYLAEALFFSGKKEEARDLLTKMAYQEHFPRALDFLINETIVQDDPAKAERMLEDALGTITPADESRVMKLANMYSSDGQKDKEIDLLDRFLEVSPNHQPAMLMKASALFGKEKYAAAEAIYLQVHKLNPHDTEGTRGIAECEQALNHTAAALRYMHEVVMMDPTNPRFILAEAQYLEWAGQSQRAKQKLLRWIRKNQHSPALPIVLYHGLTPFADDPQLAYNYHYSTAAFDAQMKAIHDAGYTPVTADEVVDWLYHDKKLPDHPIMIAFDDGRLDSFVYGDPILEKYGLKATMFAALVNMEGFRPPGFVPWQKLAAYQKNGRWDIQSHGDISHIYIPIDDKGNRSLFLTSKQWLADQNRLETDAEWRERLRSDYESSRDKIAKHIGHVPVGYAYPEGVFGQQGHCNTPDTEPVNLALVKQYFSLAFFQDPAGINYKTRDPEFLTRHEPDPHWTGKQLIQFLHDQDPMNMMALELSRMANWAGRSREAFYWLDQMKHNDAPQTILLAQEAAIRFSAGDTAAGQSLAQRAMMGENAKEVEKSITSALATAGPEWAPSFTYEDDNQGRHDWTFEQTLTSQPIWKARWSVTHRHGELFDSRAPQVNDNGIGGGVSIPLGLFNTLQANAMQHFLSGQAHDQYSAQGKLHSQLSDDIETWISGGRSLYYTARALNHNVTDTFIDVIGRFHPEGPWAAGVRGRILRLSDENHRASGQLELSRSVIVPGHLRLVYQFNYDNMKLLSSDYYSPQSLRMHAFGPEVTFKTSRTTQCTLRYLPAYAKENGTSGEIEHNAEVDLQFRFTPSTFLKPSFSYSRTPTYRENIANVTVEHYF